MFNQIAKKRKNTTIIADFLKTDKNALECFEKKYTTCALNKDVTTVDNFFNINSRQASSKHKKLDVTECNALSDANNLTSIIHRIIDELVAKTMTYTFDGTKLATQGMQPDNSVSVTVDEITALPKQLRPMLTGNLMHIDVNVPSSIALIESLNAYMTKGDKRAYHHFRQGLDILDYDELMYAIIDTNPNSMSHWFTKIAEPVVNHAFFKISKTTIARIPMTMLQLTRQAYNDITSTTFDIINKYCMKIFNLDVNEKYFIKTGTYSSKFDFRNAYVHDEKEVRELGEYLLFIHSQANQMASPLTTPTIYGVSTTTEWVVREFIQDTEDNPCIYKGMPLHTEYRVFVDFDESKIIGIAPYWEPNTMKKRFAENRDEHDIHDSVIYEIHENTLMTRYTENKDIVATELAKILPDVDLHGQWSVDIMQNGNDFWLIDMALAQNSAFYDCVPTELRKPTDENWLPDKQTIETIMKK